ncbi:MAG: c-type cytochrome [Planctomycetaceae bacterium]
MLKFIAGMLLLFPQQADSLLDAVNAERGGRHWIDQQPDPARAPDEQQATFQIEPGSRIELVAAEPLVFDPVWLDFDHRGRMFVAEYTDYPIGPVNADGTENLQAAPLSKIVLLEDTDHDGRMDRRTVFADQLKFCHSFLPLMDGILACAQTQVLFLKDTDGDNVADLREVWFDGFTPAHPQMQIGCPQWGIDNYIYLTYAPGEVRCLRPGFESAEPVKMPRQDMRFDPFTMKFEPVSGLGQFGNTIDNHGHRFFSTNRNPIIMEIIPEWATKRNRWVSLSKRQTDVGPSGGETRVYPLVAMKSNWLSHAGTHTSACGVTAYLGDLWDESFQHSVFVCEPVGHLVTRSVVSPVKNSPALTAERARPNADFLASGDTWFRPSSLRTGPDGALYLADMYRMWVEHPKFLPPEIAARIDWRAGEDRGRIWRIVPESSPANSPPFKPADTIDQLAELLKDGNGWRRRMAQQRLVESSDPSVATTLHELLKTEDLPAISAIQAMQCLRHCGELTEKDFGNSKLFVKAHAECLSLWLDGDLDRRFLFALNSAAESVDPELKLKAILACARFPDADAESAQQISAALIRLTRDAWPDPWLTDAALIASGPQAATLLATAVRTGPPAEPNSGTSLSTQPFNAATAESIRRLAELTAITATENDLQSAFVTATWSGAADHWQTAAVLKGLASGLPRNPDKAIPKSLTALLKSPPQPLSEAAQKILRMLDEMVSRALDRSRSLNERRTALELLTLQPTESARAALEQMLSPDEHSQLQETAIQVIGQIQPQQAAAILLSHWNSLTPTARATALQILVRRPESTRELLIAIQGGQVASSIIDIDQRIRLLQHSDEAIRTLAGELLGGVVSADRKAVADEYAEAVSMSAAADRGALVFEKTCSKCHRINGKGHNVGPDISDTRNRSRDALLYDILDPNRRVDPQFTAYVVVTNDGRTFNGLLVSEGESDIILRQPEGKEITLPRREIEELQATTKSLMPEGIEKDVSIQQMADLLEFLKAR